MAGALKLYANFVPNGVNRILSARSSLGRTALHMAAIYGHSNVVGMLLELPHVNVNELTSRSRCTPLIMAAYRGYTEVVGMLLQAANVDVNIKDDGGATALHVATCGGHREVVGFLLAVDTIDTNAVFTFRRRCSALHFAAVRGEVDVVKMLLKVQSTNVNARALSQSTPLHLSVCEGQTTMFDSNQRKILDKAAPKRHKEVTKILLATNNIDVNACDFRGDTPLHYAAERGNKEAVDILLATGACPNFTNKNELTPLHRAAAAGHSDVVGTFLNAPSINVNAVDKEGYTPLHYGASMSHTKVVGALLADPNVDVNVMNNLGLTTLHQALLKGISNEVKLVHSSFVLPNIHAAALDKQTKTRRRGEVVSMLLAAPGTDVNAVDIHGRTPLHSLADETPVSFETVEMVRKLLASSGINVNATDKKGNTPLHIAAANGCEEIAKVLLSAPNIDVTAHNADGMTPLDFAAGIDLTAGTDLAAGADLAAGTDLAAGIEARTCVADLLKSARSTQNI